MLRGSNYEVLEVILDKGSKIIYRCIDTLSQQKVILKVLRAELSTYEEVMKFKREYNLFLDLSREVEGVAKPIRLEELGGLFTIALEDAGGRSLTSLMAEERLPTDTLLKLAIQLVDTLSSIHDHQVIHKNLNPSTILYDLETGQARLLDLDLAVKLVKEKKEFQNTGLIEGTLPYISPEQTGRINRTPDYRSDFYALGVIFYEMFTGRPPYESGSMMEQIYAIIAKQPASPFEITQGNVTQPLSDLIMKLLEKSPEDRYRSAYGIKADLRKCLDGVASFRIGEEDKLNLFQIAQKLYGRERELDQLKTAFQQANYKGHSRLVLVTGEAGVGKTALVYELHGSISRDRGYFIQGKFDQYNKNIPYSAMIQAFRTLMAQLLNSEEEGLASLRSSLRSSLGHNGGLLVNLIPELLMILGEQPQVEPLNPTEETNRFFLSFVQFIEGLTNNEKPLVLFLDDLQWADMSSLNLLEKLVGNNSLKKLLIIGSYRNDEVHEGHPLACCLEEIEQHNEVQRILLKPLSSDELNLLIQDSLGSGTDVTQDLCRLVYGTTKGNPFFVKEMLKDLHKLGAIAFDDHRGTWNLDTGKINGVTPSEGVVNYLLKKVRALPDEALRILSLSASIGSLFDWKMLTLISEEDSEVLAKSLILAVQEDIILPLHPNYHVMAGIQEEHRDGLIGLDIQFAFQHDKIQQTLYQMIDLETRNKLHLKIGRLLLSQLSPKEAEEKLVDIARNLNKGLAYVTGEDEIDRIIDINLRSAKKVKDAFGYDTAFEFLATAIRLLTADSWTARYQRSYEIYKLYGECAYLTHQSEAGDQACRVLIEHVKHPLELAGVYEMQANHYTYLGMMKPSMEAGMLGLKSLGLKVPKRVSMVAVLRELIKVKWSLRGRTTDELLAGPEMTDERIKFMMRLLVGFIPPAFITGEHNLFGWVVLKKAYLSARYGNGPESAGAYTGYAILLSGLGDLKGARDYGMLAVRINEKFDDVQWRSLVYVLYTLFAHGWSHSWDTLEDWYKKAIGSSLKSGDLLYLAHAYYYRNLWNPSMEIERYLQESAPAISMIENTRYKEALATAKLSRQKFLTLSGEIQDPLSLDDADFREADYLKQLTDANYYSGIAIYYLTKIQLLYTFEQYEPALDYIEQAYNYIGTLAGSAFMEEFSLYTYLTLAACYKDLSWKRKLQARVRMRKEYARMKKWAAHCPDNFLPQHYMMKAERARISRRYEDAETCYNLAIQTSGRGSFIRYKALAHELTAKHYYARDRNELAAYFFRQATYYYSVWGAKGKVNQLERDYEQLQGLMNRSAVPSDKDSITASSEQIDIHAILMASQAISKEIGLDPLLDALMKIVIVNAGAERGCIVMKSSSTMFVEGEYLPEADEITVTRHDGSVYAHFPRTILDAVADNKETLIYNDAVSETAFVQDPYIARHKPKSILCMPLMNQNQVTAIIYLENNLVTGAFTKERLKMIDLLSREMVYSLENASLYSDMERLVAERTEELALKNEQLNKYIDIVDKNVMIIQTDVHGVVTDVSEEFYKSSGYGKEELLGRAHRFLQAPDGPEGQFKDFAIGSTSARVWKGELVQRMKDGSILWLDMAVEPEFTSNRIAGYTFIGHNITDKKRIEQHSITDEMTGLYNRRYFKDVFWREVKRAARNEDCLTFILLDIDYYKKYNDTYGHYEGDHVLLQIGSTINEQLRRATDFAFRLGGEEFGILYSGANAEHSYLFAEKIRKSIEALQIPHQKSDVSHYVTVSVGLAVVAAKHNPLSEEVIYKLADEALYSSKAKGRNCVTMNVL